VENDRLDRDRGQWVNGVKNSNIDGDAALKDLKAAIAKYNAGS
jgi:hypothetical protein